MSLLTPMDNMDKIGKAETVKADWTPGPWFTEGRARHAWMSDKGERHEAGAIAVFENNGVACVALVVPGCLPAQGRDDASEANARLIAAAPDMAKALQSIIDMNIQYAIDRYGDASNAETMACVVEARAALAKAEAKP